MRNRWTELPIPNEVIAIVHQLAAACRKYKGIVFTDRNGNVIDDQNNPESDNLQITGVDRHTGIEKYDTTGVTDDITGVTEIKGNNIPETNGNNTPKTITEMLTEVEDINDNTDNTNLETDADFEGFEDNTILVEQESQDDIYTMLDDMNTIHEMNTAQLYVDPETGEDRSNSELPIEELPIRNLPQTHNYNLRPRPTRTNARYNMYSMTQSSNTQKKLAKPHVHVMLTQMNVKEGIKRYGDKGNYALMKELQQLHVRQTLLPLKKGDMSYKQHKKALRKKSNVPQRKT